jgi:hypothetical protein
VRGGGLVEKRKAYESLVKIDSNDVKYTGFHASVRSRRKARQSRALDDREYMFFFEHVPTGKKVQIETGVVHWSRKETRRQIESLRVGKAVELLGKL